MKGFLSLCVIVYLSPIVSGYRLALKCVIDRNNVKFYTGQVFNITKEANGSIYEKRSKTRECVSHNSFYCSQSLVPDPALC